MRPVRFLPCLVAVIGLVRPSASPATDVPEPASAAADASFRGLVDALDERRMPDVMLWAVEAADRDPTLSDACRAELPVVRAAALVASSRTEADAQKRSRMLDEAEASIDRFLAASPGGDALIAALSQKGSLLVERGRGTLTQAGRPGADAPQLKREAVALFTKALATLERPAGAPDTTDDSAAPGAAPATSAEDAILRQLRRIDAEVARIRQPVSAIRDRVAAKENDIATVQKAVEDLDREIHACDLEKAALETQVAGNRRSIQQLRGPSQPGKGDERKDARRLKEELESRQRENLTRAARLEQETLALAQRFKELEQQRRQKLGERRKPDAELARLTKELLVLEREIEAAEKPLADVLEPALRDQEALRAKLLQTRLLAAEVRFETSRAYDPGTPEWKAAVEASTAGHRELVEKYGKLGVASVARLHQGRNEALLGHHAAALATLAPLYSLEAASGQPLAPLAVSLKTEALALALESWRATQQYRDLTGDLPFDVAAYRRNPLLRFALAPAKGGKPDPHLAAVKYRTALLLDARAAELAEQDEQAAALLRQDAVKLAREVSRAGREFARDARDLAARLGKDLPDATADDLEMVSADARTAYADMQQSLLDAKRLQGTGQMAEAARAAEQAAADRDRAIGLFEKALAMARDEASRKPGRATDDLDSTMAEADLRTPLAFLLYEAKRFDEAAALAADLAEHHPNATGSRKAAKVGLVSLQALAQQGDEAGRTSARERLISLARRIARTWPAESEGADAFAVLVADALDRGDPGAIGDLITTIPAASPRRPEFAMRLGTALRREAREAAQTASAGRPPDADVARWNSGAAAAIDEGLAAVESAGSLPADAGGKVAVAAALARAQLALEADDLPLVGRILNHPVYGPLTLAEGDSPAFSQGPLADGARALALRYFVETEQPDQVRRVLLAMDKAAGDGADASARLVTNYLAIGRDLQAQLDALTSGPQANSPEAQRQAARLVEGFETLLEGLRTRDGQLASQFFVADTYLALGTSKPLGTSVSKATADEFLARAADVFTTLLARQNETGTPAESRAEIVRLEPTIRRRLATIRKQQGRWDEAQAEIDWILSDPQRRNSLDVQREAAEVLTAAGLAVAAEDPAKADGLLREAAAGRSSAAAPIWGWAGIATKLARQAFAADDAPALKAREMFFDARIRVAQTLLERARLPGQADRAQRLEAATSAIVMTRKLYPDLGGPTTSRRFEAVLEDIQREQGATPDGFKQLDRQTGSAPAAANP
ncbi:MAG: hypothetical protein FJ286_01545 [Planctomycetes bacterium]|nr:hypothetical protein [Planctomycetota bacterium]